MPADAISCGGCGALSRQRLCPECHGELPDNVQTHESFRVAIVGPPQAGKSHLIAAQAEYLERILGPSLGVSVRPLGRTRRLVSERFHQRVCEERHTLAPTQRLMVSQEARDPLVFELTAERIGLAVNLVTFDISGEDCLEESALLRSGRHILDADAFMLLAPASPPETEALFDASVRWAFDTLVAAAAGSRRSGAELASTPFALVLTKVDRLAARGALDPRLTDGVRHEGVLSAGRLRTASDLAREMLARDEDGALLLQALDQRLKKLGCFAVSSLGADADEFGRLELHQPHRVEEPLLWLLAAARLVKVEP